MDVRVRNLAARQHDVAAAWQLQELGLGRKNIDHASDRLGWRILHPGVYCFTNAPLSQEQRWMAAALSTPATFLSHASAASCYGFRPIESPFETVVRRGSGGPRRMGDLLVFRSTTLDGETTRHNGIPITTGARALIDLAP